LEIFEGKVLKRGLPEPLSEPLNSAVERYNFSAFSNYFDPPTYRNFICASINICALLILWRRTSLFFVVLGFHLLIVPSKAVLR
jgi:hypothetical protein